MAKYNIAEHEDADLSSAQEIAKFLAEAENPIGDIGDIGIQFSPTAIQLGVCAPFKNDTWDQIPDWAKHPDGLWAVQYYGNLVFLVNTDLVDTGSPLIRGSAQARLRRQRQHRRSTRRGAGQFHGLRRGLCQRRRRVECPTGTGLLQEARRGGQPQVDRTRSGCLPEGRDGHWHSLGLPGPQIPRSARRAGQSRDRRSGGCQHRRTLRLDHQQVRTRTPTRRA